MAKISKKVINFNETHRFARSRKLKVGVIFGGRSGEHEVSIVSAQSVIKALDKKKYEVVPIGITKQGQWLAGPEAMKCLKEGIKKLPFKSLLLPDPTEKKIIKVKEKSLMPIAGAGSNKLDVVIPVMHGRFGEDGCLQGFLELAEIAYVGAEVLGSALGMDKILQKRIFWQAGLPIVNYDWFLKTEWQKNKKAIINRLEKKLKYPLFVKPANTGSSVGVSKAHNQKELVLAINEAAGYDRKIIVEQGINEISEIEVAVLGNDQPKASVPGEIIPSNEFYDYDAKYIDGQSQAIIPARLPQKIKNQVRQLALSAFLALDLGGLARVDFFVTKKGRKIYLNEVNTIPGFTSISMYPKLWAASGLSYPALLDELIKLALERRAQKNKLLTFYQPKAEWYK